MNFIIGNRTAAKASVALAVTWLVACSSGDGASNTGTGTGPATTASITMQGLAATGMPIDNAAVTARCASGADIAQVNLLRQALSLDYGAESPMGRTLAGLKSSNSLGRNVWLDVLAQRLSTAEIRLPTSGLRWTQRDRQEVEATDIDWLILPHSRLEAASRPVRDMRSARRPAGRPSSANTAAKARPEIRPIEVSLAPNSCLMGSIITATI